MPFVTGISQGIDQAENRARQLTLDEQNAKDRADQKARLAEQDRLAGKQEERAAAQETRQQTAFDDERRARLVTQATEQFDKLSQLPVDAPQDVVPGSLNVFEENHPFSKFKPGENITRVTRGKDNSLTFEVTEEIPGGMGPVRALPTRVMQINPDATVTQWERRQGMGGVPYQVGFNGKGELVAVHDMNGKQISTAELSDPKKFPADFAFSEKERLDRAKLKLDEKELKIREGELGYRERALTSKAKPNAETRWDKGMPEASRSVIVAQGERLAWNKLAAAYAVPMMEGEDKPGIFTGNYSVPNPETPEGRRAQAMLDQWRQWVIVEGQSPSSATEEIYRRALAETGALRDEVDVRASQNDVSDKMPTRAQAHQDAPPAAAPPTPAAPVSKKPMRDLLPPAGQREYDALKEKARSTKMTKEQVAAELEAIGRRYGVDTPDTTPPNAPRRAERQLN